MSLSNIRQKNKTKTSILFLCALENAKLSQDEIQSCKRVFYGVVEPINKETVKAYNKIFKVQ